MQKLAVTLITIIMSLGNLAYADQHSESSESEVLEALSAYMDARNTRDFKAVIALSSKSGTLDTNSD
ncbi:MAG: DUF4440 domain-containing protein, partial [Porticoccaceae bacterium]|nr:DUF4440 domain-containing protein [Porticoccaceae bacterium]